MVISPALEVKKIRKSFADIEVLKGISFNLFSGEIVALLGPSGCGKSTILSIIAGIESQDEGEIFWNSEPLDPIPPHKRDFGLMFQDNVLFPHLDVFENIAFGLKMSGIEQDGIQDKVSEILDLVGLSGYEKRDVNSLSGGEQQRVALARALAPKPQLLMLDEPLGSIDRSLRERLMGELRRILRGMQQTAIYVTHDQEEAFAIADRIVLMREGKVEQIGKPEEIYRHPSTLFTARFLGLINLIPGEVRNENNQQFVDTTIGSFPISKPLKGQVTVLIRPDSATIDGHTGIQLRGKIIEKTFRGNLCQVRLTVEGTELMFNFLSNLTLAPAGEEIQLSFDPQDGITVFEDTADN